MAANDDVLIVGKLDSKELEKSINDLIDFVGDKTTIMAGKFDSAMDKMKSAMKDFAITQKVSVDLIKQSWRDMSASFDAMFKAEKEGTGGGKGKGGGFEDETLGALKAENAEIERKNDLEKVHTKELQDGVDLLTRQKNEVKELTKNTASKQLEKALSIPSDDLSKAKSKLQELEKIQTKYANTTDLSTAQQTRLANAIARCKKEIDKFNSSKPKTLKDVMGMDESSLDAVAKKMRALKLVNIDPNNKTQLRDVGNEYARLGRLQAELMGKSVQLTHANNYLAQSFGYIRNRIVYALTLGAITNFTKQIYEVRGQYELLERSLGILIDDMRRGSEVFNELNIMALKSPFTLMELATGAKQLLAYNFAEEEVVDTTRRLADISAALGVPMERLVYNLGQIRAQTALTARDARDFANAGLAIVPMLAQMYTEEKRFGEEIVTTSQVFDMMSKKLVSYADVMKVINKVTDEGGKFFDFQAKQADTLKVKMANLTLSWNNMLNDIGREQQDVLTAPLKGLKLLFENWRKVYEIIKDLIVLFGLYRARVLLVSIANGTLITQGAIAGMYNLGRAVAFVTNAWKTLSVVVAANPIGAIATVLSAAAASYFLFGGSVEQATEEQERFGEAGAKVIKNVESLFDSLKGISSESSNYKKIMGELNSILSEYNIEVLKETDGIDVINKKREVAISLLKQEALERKHLNDIQQGRETYESTAGAAKQKLRSDLKNAMTGMVFLGANEELRRNAEAITNIINDIVDSNITLIANKTGEEYERGIEEIYAKIQDRMRAIGISESTIAATWRDDSLFMHNNLVQKFIDTLKDAKEQQDRYTKAVDDSYEAEKRAAEQNSTFNDKVEQTQTSLMKAANDTDKFAKKIESLLKEYGGQNIIKFLVDVQTNVPEWMSQKGLKELTQLSARFTALAVNAKNAGKAEIDFGNGVKMTQEQLFERAAQYSQAAKNKAADIEARKSTTITREASEALKEYKAALEAVSVAKNRLKQGTGDQALVTEKEESAQKAYNKALEKGVSLKDLLDAKNGKGKSGSKKDVLGDTIAKEIQLITDMQKLYKEYQKAGVNADDARIASAKEYEKTLKSTNTTLAKFGVKGIDGETLVTMNLHQLRDYYKQMLDIANLKGNTKGVEALEKAIRGLNTEITKIDYKHITDGLNNELGKLKDEYELAIELDANPELGGIFTDMFDINLDELPKTAEEYASMYTERLNIAFKKLGANIELPDLVNLTRDDLEEFANMVKENKLNEVVYELIKKGYDATRQALEHQIRETVKSWESLLEKYAEYETKLTKIATDAENERKVARRMNAPQWVFDAINNMEKERKAQAAFEKFQKEPEWLIATGDLAGMTDQSLRGLVNTLEDYKKKGNLTTKQTKEINKALVALHKQIRKGNPFHAIADAMDEANMRASVYDEALEKTSNAIDRYMSSLSDLSDDERKKLKQLIDEYNRLLKLKERDSKVDASTIVNGINDAIAVAKQASGIFTDMMDALGGTNGSEAAKRINQIVSVLEKGAQGASIGAQFGGYGALIGGVVGTLSGVITTFWDEWSGNADITEEINDSVEAVKDLENAYKRLEIAAEQYYGSTVVASKEVNKGLKELELLELRRQLELEQSRSTKNRDEERIRELRSEIIDLENEVKNATKETINDLLGISSHADFFESLISDMINAFKNGEDAMEVFKEKWESMIDSMVTKIVLGEVLQQWVKSLEQGAQNVVEKYTKYNTEEIANLEANIEKIESQDVYKAVGNIIDNDAESWEKIAEELGLSGLDRKDPHIWYNVEKIRDRYLEMLREQLKIANSQQAKLSMDATEDLLDYYTQAGEEFKHTYMQSIIDKLSEIYTYGQSANGKQLSELQQGISGITETQAGSLEAYWNANTQQQYLQSDLLTQICDALNLANFDIHLDLVSKMLLQLQNTYVLVESMHTMMSNWETPAGNGIRVQLLS